MGAPIAVLLVTLRGQRVRSGLGKHLVSIGYLVRRLLVFVLITWLAITVNFCTLRVTQMGAELERLRQGHSHSGVGRSASFLEVKLGLDRPLWEQYATWLGSAATLDLGYSRISYPRTVRDMIGEALPWTVALLDPRVAYHRV